MHGLGLRPCRYLGLAKTRLQHVMTGAAMNLWRLAAWLSEEPQGKTRVSRFARAGLEGRIRQQNPLLLTPHNGLSAMGRGHATVCHKRGEWARDDDGDGVREVHDNTLEGLWTGLRNFLRTFRGVSKEYQYVAMFEWSYNVKRATPRFLAALLGVGLATTCPT